MAKKGRPKGVSSRYCLIEDDVLSPFTIHVDEGAKCFVLMEGDKVKGYYTQLPYAVKAILKTKYIPNGSDGKSLTLKQYIKQLSLLRDEMVELLIPAYHKIK